MSAIDDLGFVSLDDIQSVFVTEMDKIEQDVKTNGMPMDYKLYVEFIDQIRSRLLMRAKNNLKSYLKLNPEVRKEIRQERDASREKDVQTWQDRVKANRAVAIQDALTDRTGRS